LKACRQGEIENLRFHDSRHEGLTRLARKLDVLDLARMVGHRDPRSLMIYYNPTATEIAERLD
jgi:integrase